MKRKIISIPRKTIALFANIAKTLEPPPDIDIAEWADMYRQLARGTSAEPGRWRTDRNPHQRAIMEAISDKSVSKVVVKSSAQIGKTEIILNTLGYYIDHKPAPILLLQPTVELVKKFSKKRIAGMVEATPRLQNRIKSAKTRDSDNTILNKKFPGGFLTLVGANAPSGLASEPIKIVLCDEVDRYPESADKEGDPVSLAEARTSTFWDRKIVLMSTPTNEETSRIHKEYLTSSQSEYCLPCPYCGKLQPIVFPQIDFKTLEHKCVFCNDSAGEYAWKKGKGEYIAKFPDNPVKGFHINALSVNLGNDWGMIVNQFLKAKQNTQTLKVFVNTVLGECWNDSTEEIDHQALYHLREPYEAELPEGVLFLTAGVDVQDNRLEVEVCGWGKGFETWGIEYKQILGSPRFDEVWNQLDDYLKKEFLFKDGNGLSIACTCVDTGYEAKYVYKWVKQRENRNIFCIKGDDGWGRPIVARSRNRNDYGARLLIAGVDSGKSFVMDCIRRTLEESAKNKNSIATGNEICHFPLSNTRGYDEQYFKSLLSEKLFTKFTNGKITKQWRKITVRNEGLDLRVYNYVAYNIISPNLELLEEQIRQGKNYVRVTKAKKQRPRGVVKRGDIYE